MPSYGCINSKNVGTLNKNCPISIRGIKVINACVQSVRPSGDLETECEHKLDICYIQHPSFVEFYLDSSWYEQLCLFFHDLKIKRHLYYRDG